MLSSSLPSWIGLLTGLSKLCVVVPSMSVVAARHHHRTLRLPPRWVFSAGALRRPLTAWLGQALLTACACSQSVTQPTEAIYRMGFVAPIIPRYIYDNALTGLIPQSLCALTLNDADFAWNEFWCPVPALCVSNLEKWGVRETLPCMACRQEASVPQSVRVPFSSCHFDRRFWTATCLLLVHSVWHRRNMCIS